MLGPRIIDLGNPVARERPENQNLTQWWLGLEHNSGGGTTLHDLCGNAAATLIGSGGVPGNEPTWLPVPPVPGTFGLTFDGTAQRGVTSLNLSSLGTGPFAVAAWIRTTISGTARGMILSNYDDLGGGGQYFLFRVGNTANPYLQCVVGNDGDGGSALGTTALNDGVWRHVAAVRDSGGTLKVYVNGIEEGSGTAAQTVTNTRPCDIGVLNAGVFVQHYPGDLAGLRFHTGTVPSGWAAAVYDQERSGLPDVLRRFTPKSWVHLGVGVAGGGVVGEATITFGALTSSSAGTLAIAGAAAVTLGSLTLSSTGTLALAGTASITLDSLTLSASGAVAITGASSITLGSLATTGAGTLAITGAAAISLGSLTLTATGQEVSPITGTASVTLGNLTLVSTGSDPRLVLVAAFSLTPRTASFELDPRIAAYSLTPRTAAFPISE